MEKTHLHKVKELDFRVAKTEDIPVLCELLWELFSQEVEFIPNYLIVIILMLTTFTKNTNLQNQI